MSDVRREESTPSGIISSPTSGMPRAGRALPKGTRPRTAGPGGGGVRRVPSRGNINDKYIDDRTKDKRVTDITSNETKMKNENKRARSGSHRRQN